jgi:capsule biosynthesis phosphatase
MEKQTFIMDVDGTICQADLLENGKFDYENAKPIAVVINRINELYDAGHQIIISTARGMRTYKGDIKKIEKEITPVLEKWLTDNAVKYHQLVVGKAWGENPVYVDNRSLSLKSFAIENPEFFESMIRVDNNVNTYI